MNDIHIKGLPSPQQMVFASGESPPSEWDSPARRFPPFPGGSLFQVNDIHLKGLPLSTANGIRFRGVPSSKRMVFSSRGFPLHSEWDSFQRIPLVNSEWNSQQMRNPLQEIGIRTKRVTLSKANGFASRGSPSPKRLGFAPKGLPLQANGIRIRRVAFSKANGIHFYRRASLQQETPFQGFFSEAALLKGFPFPH